MSRWKPDAAGRLVMAAITLFDQCGYEATTVSEIATAAGLTRRTFFRYFADKREVLFLSSSELQDLWVRSVADAPAQARPMEAIATALDAVAQLFATRHAFARVRARIIAENPELQERELIKLSRLANAVADGLHARGVPETPAALAAQTGVTVFNDAFRRWVRQDDPTALRRLMTESLTDLRAVVMDHAAAPPRPGRA